MCVCAHKRMRQRAEAQCKEGQRPQGGHYLQDRSFQSLNGTLVLCQTARLTLYNKVLTDYPDDVPGARAQGDPSAANPGSLFRYPEKMGKSLQLPPPLFPSIMHILKGPCSWR